MTSDDIIRMAREAGWRFADEGDHLLANHAEWQRQLFERFAALVAAAEREAICRIVTGLCISDNNAEEINRAIRARGKT